MTADRDDIQTISFIWLQACAAPYTKIHSIKRKTNLKKFVRKKEREKKPVYAKSKRTNCSMIEYE